MVQKSTRVNATNNISTWHLHTIMEYVLEYVQYTINGKILSWWERYQSKNIATEILSYDCWPSLRNRMGQESQTTIFLFPPATRGQYLVWIPDIKLLDSFSITIDRITLILRGRYYSPEYKSNISENKSGIASNFFHRKCIFERGFSSLNIVQKGVTSK